MAVQALFNSETEILRRAARTYRFWWTKHALASLDYGCTTNDVEKMLTKCQVILVEHKKDILWRAAGKDVDGREIQAVVAIYEDRVVIKVVTTFLG